MRNERTGVGSRVGSRTSKWTVALGVGVAAMMAVLVGESDARACGGCFAPPGPSTQVSAHRMAFAISNHRTVLWDQIQYVGSPSSFGWVLPIKSAVDVGVSSDELFSRLDNGTKENITPPPPPECAPPTRVCRTTCDRGGFGAPGSAGSDTATAADGGVTVWDSGIVGPYEATQLSATDGTALRNWLKDHGYVLPDAIAPIVDAYIAEGFGFLAIKLVPGAGVGRMTPIRIAFDGASPTLPLRMVAAGTGAQVGIKLFILGEGRWEAKNFDNAEIATADLSWNWSGGGSNFGQLEIDAIAAHPNGVWIAETATEYPVSTFFDGLPAGTTTTDAGTVFSTDTDQLEIGRAFPGRANVNVTRLFAQLPAASLGNDLQLQASLGGTIPVTRQATKSTGFYCPSTVEVECPGVSPPCDSVGYDAGTGSPGGDLTPPFFTGPKGSGASPSGGGNGCSTSAGGSTLPWVGLGLLGALGLSAARRRRAR